MTKKGQFANTPSIDLILLGIFMVGCFLFFQLNLRFFYYFMEQYTMFQTTSHFFTTLLRQPGGLNEYLSQFFMQAFHFNGGAALTFSLFSGLLAYSFYTFLRKLGTKVSMWIAILPGLLFWLFPVDSIAPLLSAVIALLSANLYTLAKGKWRMGAGLILLILNYFGAAPANLLLMLLFCLFELCTVKEASGKWLSAFWIGMGILIPLFARACIFVIPLREAFLSKHLYHPEYPVPFSFWLFWFSFPLISVICYFLRKTKIPGTTRTHAIFSIGLLFIVIVTTIAIGKHPLEQAYRYDYYARNDQWEKITAHVEKAGIQDKDVLVYANLAFSKTGRFNEMLLQIPQIGENGLIPHDPKSRMELIEASEVAWHLNHINSAQRFAFVGALSSQRCVQPRLMKRLVETYLVNEEYKAAGKYIKILESVPLYRKWAKEQSALFDISLADTTPWITEKRALRSLTDNPFDLTVAFSGALAFMLDDHPDNQAAFEYAMGYLLIEKDFGTFIHYMEAVRDAGKPLPTLYQEALCIIYATHQDPEAFRSYSIDPAIYNRFLAFLKATRTLPPSALKQEYGDTYYYYAQFIPAPKQRER